MNPYVVFVNWRQPRTNTTNVHLTSCGHYRKYIRNGRTTQNTLWIEAPDFEAARVLAHQNYQKHGTLGVKLAMSCCNSRPP